ncbi:hypothetical protein POM88_047187 [Heracleum sosnowskyi]|uniref:MULE transposase domain-containing protein n=1 Tax=Heracleum sosnowskyi TaxID=360622 RepID=A0AAD8HAI4_9APIA|nr:hypothetical protein POM88_047187 [Heracleum sosnowskyi]
MLSEDEKIKAKEMTRARVSPSHILISIKNENKDILTTVKQMYNYRQTIKKKMEGRSVIQQLFSYLSKKSYFYSYQVSPITNMITDLFFANRKTVQLLHEFYHMLIMDYTYKTNKYKMPLLEIVGVVPTGNFFVVGYAFLQDEKKDSFEWALRCTKDFFDLNHDLEAIVTNIESALIHAIHDIFPKSYHMLCKENVYISVGEDDTSESTYVGRAF